jgi:hypothetical protein
MLTFHTEHALRVPRNFMINQPLSADTKKKSKKQKPD